MSRFDHAAEAFGDALLTIINHGALALMISLGHRAKLFDAMERLPASTSREIAAAAGLEERYVREWLGAMVTGGIVEVDVESRLYVLPPEHAAMLTRAAGPNNMAAFAQYLPVLGAVEDDVLACFKKGGGVPYERYPRVHAVLAESASRALLPRLESQILPLVPHLAQRLRDGIRVLDLGCGSGRVTNHLAAVFPNSRFTGFDLSAQAIATAEAEARTRGMTNSEFQVRDLADFHDTAPERAYEWITSFDAIHDQPQPLNVLRGVYRALTDNGVYLMQEIKASSFVYNNIGHPLGPFLYTVSAFHCMTVSLAQQGEGLGAMWGREKAVEYLTTAGFRNVDTYEFDDDLQNSWYVVTK
jgi:ubiquinone/menaquinone biosynthesis C-methylase UbiE